MTTSLRSWASALGGTVSGTSILCPGPGHSRKDRSLSVRLSASAPDGFLVYSHAGDNPLACKDFIRSKLGLPAFTPQRSSLATVPGIGIAPQATPEPALDSNLNGERALRIWCEAADIRGTIAEHYLNSRHLILDDSDWYRVLRLHPSCPFGSERAPAMIALMRDIVTDEPRCIQRTRLAPDGKKIDRKMLGPAKGAAIKIDADADVTMGLTIGEGLETGLSARQIGFQPAWAVGSAGAIGNFPVLDGIEGLTILAEAGESSRTEVQKCFNRWRAVEIDVVIRKSTVGSDINDAIIRGAA